MNKGLKFCPAQKGVNYTQLLADLFRLERKMAWKHYFKDFEPLAPIEEKDVFPFPDQKKKTNVPKDYPKEISNFISSVRSELIGAEKKKSFLTLQKKNGKL